MKVLLVAPRTDLLLVDEEVEDVMRSGLTVTPMLGKVNATELLREIKRGEYDVLWLATHGDSNGIQLSDGFLSTSELVAQVRDRFTLVVLNTCSSLLIAQQLQEGANVGVICTVVDVPDKQAYQTGSLLASALIEAPGVAAAYKRSKPGGNRVYLYLAALSPSEDVIESLLLEIRDLRSQMKRQASNQLRNMVVTIALHSATWAALLYVLAKGY